MEIIWWFERPQQGSRPRDGHNDHVLSPFFYSIGCADKKRAKPKRYLNQILVCLQLFINSLLVLGVLLTYHPDQLLHCTITLLL